VFEDVTGVRVMDANAFPRFYAWLRDFERPLHLHRVEEVREPRRGAAGSPLQRGL
jgi:hypothetical protein